MFQCLRSSSAIAAVVLSLAACGGGGGGGSQAADTGIKGVAVDPYIVGAAFCEDKNTNGVCDPGEQVSTASDAAGRFTFSNALTLGSDIIIAVQGTHNGVTYTGDIKRKVDQADDLVVSPLTTLLANGWTAANVVAVLNSGGITGLTGADLTKDPMAGIEALDGTSLTTDHFKIVKSSIAVHSFLSIMKGVLTGPTITGGGYNITYSLFSSTTFSNGLKPQDYVDRMVDCIGSGLDPALVSSISSSIATASAICASYGLTAPPATAGDVIRGSVAIADHVIPRVVADLSYAPTLAEYGPWRSQLGLRFYLIRTKDHPCIRAGINSSAFTGALGQNFNLNWTSCRINSSGEVECF